MLPRFSMAFNRRTSTPCRAIICAPLRQVDAENRRQQLGAEPHGQRDGEEQRVDRRPAAEHVRDEDEQHHDQHGARQQVAEAADAAVELRFRRPKRQAMRDGAELGR